jgi:branched-chain amino acid aminotransferase
VSPFDHGLVVGDGVFETVLVRAGRPFALSRHLARLAHSARGLGLAPPPADDLADAIGEVLAAEDLAEGVLRITWTSGPGPLGSRRGGGRPTLLVAAGPAPSHPETESIVTVPWPRNERGALAGLKTISYAENARALAHAEAMGGGEALFLNTRGELCEGTGSNVLLVVDGRLVTPPLEAGCLAGVTRALVIERSGELVEEAPLRPDDLARASEVLLASTTRGVQAVSMVDGVPRPAPGPVASRLATWYRHLVATEDEP